MILLFNWGWSPSANKISVIRSVNLFARISNWLKFPEIKISKDNSTFTASVYGKFIFSGVFIRFGSFIPKSLKYNLLFTLLHRAFKICSNFDFFHQEVYKISIFKNNDCPKAFVYFCIRKYLDKFFVEKKVGLTATETSFSQLYKLKALQT